MKYEFTVYIQVECKLTATVNLLSKLLASQLPAILTVKLRSYFLQCTAVMSHGNCSLRSVSIFVVKDYVMIRRKGG